MFSKRKKRGQSVFVKWLVSYLIVVMVFFVTSAIVYFNIEKVVVEQTIETNNYLLNHVRTSFDNIIKEMQNTAMQTIFNPKIYKLTIANKYLEDSDYYDSIELSKYMQSLMITNKSISDIALVIRNNDTVFSTNGAQMSREYFYSTYSANADDYEKWVSQIGKGYKDQYINFDYIDRFGGDQKRKILYIHSVDMNINNTNVDVYAVVSVDVVLLEKSITEFDKINKSEMFVYNPNGEISVKSENSTDPQLQLDITKKSYNKINIGNWFDKSVVSITPSEISKWRYVSIIPERIYLSKIRYVRNISLIGMFLALILGSYLIYYFTKRNYNPISQLLKMFSENNYNSKSDETNEFAIIENAISKVYKDKEKLETRLDLQKNALKKQMVEKLLQGKILKSNMTSERNEIALDLNFSTDKFVVVEFYIDETTIDELSTLENKERFTYNEIQFILNNVVEEMINEYHLGIMVDLDNIMTCLVNIKEIDSDINTDTKRQLISVFDSAKEKIYEYFKINFTISMSDIHNGLESISVAYNQALEVVRYKQTMGINATISYNEIKDVVENNGLMYYPFSKEQQIINAVKAGDAQGALDIINEIIDVNRKSNMINHHTIEFVIINIVSTMIKVINQLNGTIEDEILQKYNPMECLLPSKTFEELQYKLHAFLIEVSEVIIGVSNQNLNWINKTVIPYIESSYSDPDLNVTKIAQHFNRHPVYFSRIFKEQMNEGILEYISKGRIEKVKEMLKNTNLNLEDIASQTGYTNARTLSRIFKKVEGITPGKYKEIG